MQNSENLEQERIQISTDSIWSKIFVGLAIAAGSSIISLVVAKATYEPPAPPKPVAVIVPDEIQVQSNTLVEFSAIASKSADGGPLVFKWYVGGLPANQSPVARCAESVAILTCRFALPGTFAVSARVTGENGQADSISSSVTVSIQNGYVGFIMNSDNVEARKAILYDIDWVRLQALVAKPIILEDPITGFPIYAALAENPADQGEQPSWRRAAEGLKVALPAFSSEIDNAFRAAFQEVGAVPVRMSLSDVISAHVSGSIDGGFVLLSNPSDLN